MAKLRLELDQLSVDTFETATGRAEVGTVFGEECTCPTQCTCPGCPTCDQTRCGEATCATCMWNQQTCQWSCGGSCWYTECQGTNITCDPTADGSLECCPY